MEPWIQTPTRPTASLGFSANPSDPFEQGQSPAGNYRRPMTVADLGFSASSASPSSPVPLTSLSSTMNLKAPRTPVQAVHSNGWSTPKSEAGLQNGNAESTSSAGAGAGAGGIVGSSGGRSHVGPVVEEQQQQQQPVHVEVFKKTEFDATKPALHPKDLTDWEHPTLKVLDTRYRFARPFTFRQVVWNLAALVVLYFAAYSSVFKGVEMLLTKASIPPTVLWGLVYTITAACTLSLATGIKNYYFPNDQYSDLALTAKQRKLLGLDPNASTYAPEKQKPAPAAEAGAAPKPSARPVQLPSPSLGERRMSSHISPMRSPQGNGGFQTPKSPGAMVDWNSPGTALTSVPSSPAPSFKSPSLASSTLTSPARSPEDHFITDKYTLRQFLGQQVSSHQVIVPKGLIPLGSPAQVYHAALRPPQQAHAPTSLEGVNPQESQSAQDLLIALKIDENYLDEWSERLRKWLAERVFHPLIERMARMDKVLEQYNLQAFGLSSPAQAPDFYEAMMRSTSRDFTQERKTLERYVSMPNCPREYLVQRLKELSEGSLLVRYIWNSGGLWHGKPWTKDLPCDAQVVMHVFRSFMDEILVGENPRANNDLPFTNVYYSFIPDPVPFSRAVFLIRSVNQYPPHFNLLIDKRTWAVIPGRNNVFHSIVLFLHYVKTAEFCKLGNVNLAGSYLALIPSVFGY